MSLKNLRSTGDTDRVRDVLQEAAPVVVRIEADGRTALVFSDGPNAKAGSRLALVPAKGNRGEPLDAVLAGKAGEGEQKQVHRTGPGDVIVFENAIARGDELLCGTVAARMHDGMETPVQAMRMLARPSRIRVSEHGAFQFLTLADPGMAARVGSREDLAALVESMRAKPWPGGTPGLILRNAHKPLKAMSDAERRESVEVSLEDGENVAAFVRRLVDTNEILSNGPVEAIPTWSVPMGRAQMFRENVDLKAKSGQAQAGAFGRLYQSKVGKPRLGFLPSFVIIADEEEWAFKAKTGKLVRTCAGLHPLRLSEPVMASDIVTALRNDPRSPRQVISALSLYKDAGEVRDAMERRAARRGPSERKAPVPQATGREATRPGLPPRPGTPPRSGIAGLKSVGAPRPGTPPRSAATTAPSTPAPPRRVPPPIRPVPAPGVK